MTRPFLYNDQVILDFPPTKTYARPRGRDQHDSHLDSAAKALEARHS